MWLALNSLFGFAKDLAKIYFSHRAINSVKIHCTSELGGPVINKIDNNKMEKVTIMNIYYTCKKDLNIIITLARKNCWIIIQAYKLLKIVFLTAMTIIHWKE